jgi:hypothetical protein
VHKPLRDMKFRPLAITIFCVIAIGVWVHHEFGRPMLYELPSGFKRWVVVHFEDPSCPPLHKQGVFLVVPVPSSGQVCTSTRHPEGWIYYRFEYLQPNGKREPLSLRSGTDPAGKVQVYLLTYQPEEKWEIDFVGYQGGSGPLG